MERLHEFNRQVRRDILTMLGRSGSGHPGGSLSIVEVLSVLYNQVMNISPENLDDPNRDYLVLSKGHAAPALYSVLARKDFFSTEELWSLRKFKSMLQGHPDRNKVPGIEASTGSLGQGVSMSVGIALGKKLQGGKSKVYAITGDGEAQEGQFWEAAMSAAHYKLDNYTVVIDKNNLQIDGRTDEVMSLGDLTSKMRSFGFQVLEVDGHNLHELKNAFEVPHEGLPKCIVANTIKGKGVSFMEDLAGWHGKAPNKDEVELALKELEV